MVRTLALPQALTTPRDRLVKVNARIVRHGRYVVFQLAAVAGTRFLPSGGPQGPTWVA